MKQIPGLTPGSVLRGSALVPWQPSAVFPVRNRVLPAPSSELITEYIDHLLEHRQLSQANDLRRQAYLLLFFAELTDFHEKQSGQNKKSHEYSTSVYVELAIEYITSMYQNGIGISDIASNIGISRAYLNSAFQKELNMSAQSFLIDYECTKQPACFWVQTCP